MRLPGFGTVQCWNIVEQMLNQHHIDIMRLWKALRDAANSGGFGTRDSDAWTISQQFERFVRLVDDVHHGVSAGEATIQQWGGVSYGDTTDPAAYPNLLIDEFGAVLVNGYLLAGVRFAGEIVPVKFDIDSQTWLVQGDGRQNVRGVLTQSLGNNSSATMDISHRAGTITVHETLGGLDTPLPVGRKVKAWWQMDGSHWEVDAAGCSS